MACVVAPPTLGLSTPAPLPLFFSFVHHPVPIFHFLLLPGHGCLLFFDEHLLELLIAFGLTIPYHLALLQHVETGSLIGAKLAFPTGGEADVQFTLVVVVEIREKRLALVIMPIRVGIYLNPL